MLSLKTLNGPFNGLQKKIDFIKSCYPRTIADTRLRNFAENSAGKGSREVQVAHLFNAIKQRVSYMRDPVGLEMTKSPTVMMDEIVKRGQTYGDCDDQACFGYTLLSQIGIPAKLRVTWYEGSKMPRHIYLVANVNNKWVPFDTTRDSGVGTEAPYTAKRDF